MIMHEQDPDVVRWGLNTLIDICALPRSGSCNSVTHYSTNEAQVGYVVEGYSEPLTNNVENDAVIALALQEELSRVADAEASGFHNSVQESILTQSWMGPEHKNDDCSSKDDNDSSSCRREETDEMSISFPSPGDGEEESLHSVEIADESTLDGEVGKRLNQMVPIPHVPKINGEIPSEDEIASDHQRLLDRFSISPFHSHSRL